MSKIIGFLLLIFLLWGCREHFFTKKARTSFYLKKYAEIDLKRGNIKIMVQNDFDSADFLKVYLNDCLLFNLSCAGHKNEWGYLPIIRDTICNSIKPNVILKVNLNDTFIQFFEKEIAIKKLNSFNISKGKNNRVKFTYYTY